MGFISVTISLLALLFLLIYLYFKKSFSYWRSKGIPYVEPIIPYGNIKGVQKYIHDTHFTQNIYNKFKDVNIKFCGMYFFNEPVALLLDPLLIKQILVKDYYNFNDRVKYYNEIDDPLSAHLFSLSHEKWKKLRVLLTPTFSSGKIKFMFPTIIKVANRFVEYIQNEMKSTNQIEIEIEMKDLFARFTTDVIGIIAYGIECNSLKDPDNEFRQMGNAHFQKPRHNWTFRFFLSRFSRFAKFLHIKAVRDDVSLFFMNIVKNTIEYREKNNIERNDFMNLLIKLKNEGNGSGDSNKLTINEVAAQAFLFFVAGFETSSTTLTFIFYELALNPDIQMKAREEIREVLKNHNGELTYEAMNEMKYVDQIVDETLRKYSAFGNMKRYALNDYTVPGTNHVIEKGLAVLIPIYAIQHDPKYFPDPEQFDPDRFSQSKARDNIAWLAFGDGPRNCIGARFAIMQIKICLISMIDEFEFSMNSKTVVPVEFIPTSVLLGMKGGCFLNVKSAK